MGSPYPPQQPYYMPPLPPYERRPSWFQRNKKMAIAGGCALVALLLLMVVGFVAAIALWVMSLVKSSGAYAEAVDLARGNAEVRAALGEPIEEGWFVTGSVNSSGASADASLSIPLHGPKGAGTLYVEGQKRAGVWRYSILEFEVSGTEQRIPLLASVPPGESRFPQPEALPPDPSPQELPAQPAQ
ncbi:MAG: hypothetical protein IT170_12005 [Bryobacterales bacterium]|nr:hypothetical protein [Bryobacterales bacterium]